MINVAYDKETGEYLGILMASGGYPGITRWLIMKPDYSLEWVEAKDVDVRPGTRIIRLTSDTKEG